MDTPCRVDSKLPDVGVSIFAVMTRLADEHGAINLSQGFPDFDCDPALVAAVAPAHAGRRTTSTRRCRACWRCARRSPAKIDRLYGARVRSRHRDHGHVRRDRGALRRHLGVRPPGRRGGALRAVLRRLRAGRPPERRHAAVRDAARAGLPRSTGTRCAASLSPRTRLLIVNSPHNPTGAVLDARTTCDAAGGAARRHRTSSSLSDEVYEHIVFDGRAARERRAPPGAARARSCVVSSFGKTYHTTGWKVGYVAAPQALTAEIQRVHQFVTFATNTPVQLAYAEFTRRGAPATTIWRRSTRPSATGSSSCSRARASRRCPAAARTSRCSTTRAISDDAGHGLRHAAAEGSRRGLDPDVRVSLQ